MDTKCNKYWGKSDILPISAILDYWCENKGDDCKEAKKYAIIQACNDGDIAYESDVPWKTSLRELAEKDLLLIRRESFDKWAACFLEESEVAIPPVFNTKSEQTLLKIIGALIAIHYDKPAFKKGDDGRFNMSAIENDILSKLQNDTGLKDGTIRKRVPDAVEKIKENFKPW